MGVPSYQNWWITQGATLVRWLTERLSPHAHQVGDHTMAAEMKAGLALSTSEEAQAAVEFAVQCHIMGLHVSQWVWSSL